MKSKRKGFLVVANSIQVDGVPDRIKILPFGLVKSRKGPFTVDEAGFREMYQYFKDRQLDVVIDYEHQTLEGSQAPAAGWIKDMELTKDGVMASVEWTDKAKEYLANKEYRYLSPVVLKRKEDDKAVRLHSVGLTNTPAIDGMTPIINSLDMDFDFDDKGDENMDFLKEIAKLLGLSEEATQEQVIEAIKKLSATAQNQEVVANKTILEMLDLKEDCKLEDVTGKIIALKNPAGYVSVEKFNELAQKIQKKESDDLVQMALSTGKITPAQKEWAEVYALKDPSGFKNFVDNAPQVVPLEEIVTGDPKPKKKVDTELEMSVNKMLGLSKDDIEKYGKDVE